MKTWEKLHRALPDWFLIVVTVLVAVLFLSCLFVAGAALAYRGKILPNISVGGAYVGGMKYDDAREAIGRRSSALAKGVPVRFEASEFMLSPETDSLNPDVSPLVVFDDEASFNQVAAIGRDQNYVRRALAGTEAMLKGRQFPLVVTVDRQRLISELRAAFAQYEKPATNARLILNSRNEVSVGAETEGSSFDYEAAATEAAERFTSGSVAPIELRLRQVSPEISQAEVGDVQADVDRLLATPAAHLKFEKSEWLLDKKALRSLIGFVKENGQVRVAIDQEATKAYLEKEVVPDINREPVQARLAIENGRVSIWQEGKDGVAVDLTETAKAIAAWPETGVSEITVSVIMTAAKTADESAEEMGIKEIIGTGTSKFAGSPANRRHNIKTGAMALHGLLIKPGEEFSLLKALGNIDASNGYKTELVIKGNKTIPEYGGGLCQIGTTVFRATFNTGLPVTQRRNHSYRVSYYEPAGTDATIYDPAPDYRFVNDTGHYILIQARFGTNEVSFDFWGTKDGRQVEVTKPTIYNIVAPKPTRIVETPDLPEGQKKCTESAHAGADAFFDTKVTYPDGTVKEKRFTSHYVPWQAVCLVGAKKSAGSPVPSTGPTSTVTPTATPAN